MIKRIPLAELQKALFKELTDHQTTTVYNKVSSDATYPYIKIGAFTCKPNASKDTDISDVTTQIIIYSNYEGSLEVNEISNDVIHVIGSPEAKLDLSADGFNVISQAYDFFESFEDDYGYNAVITFVAKIQNLGLSA